MEATAREYGIFFSFGANPEVFRRMQTFNDEVGERRFNSQVLIRPQGILTNFKSRTNPFRFTDSWLNLTRDGAINWDTPDAEAYTLETLRTPSVREQLVGVEDRLQTSDRVSKFFGFLGELIALQAGQTRQAHIEDSLGLALIEQNVAMGHGRRTRLVVKGQEFPAELLESSAQRQFL